MTVAVDFKNVSIIFGDRPDAALKLVDEGKSRDDIGKSTLLRAVNGLAPVVRGEVSVNTKNGAVSPYSCSPKALRDLRMHTVSMVFQQFALLPWRTVADNVGFGLELAGVSDAERKKRVDEQLQLVNLTQWANRKVNELSGGMQQRVGLARAFATGAPILLMDEPFSALDPLIRTRLQDELLEFQRRLKRTILFVSHDLDEAFRIGNRIAIMESGHIIQCGTPQEIVKNPADQYVADFVQHMNPISMLTARDVMQQGVGHSANAGSVTATATAATPLIDILEALTRQPGNIGVVDNGTIIGTISAQDVVSGLTSHRRKE